MLAFADPEIIKMLKEDYVPVAVDDWYWRRNQDAEGQFFMKVGNQGHNAGGVNRQGLYCVTPSGKVISHKNEGSHPDRVRRRLQESLTEWKDLPEEERKPGAIKVEELTERDAKYVPRTPPPGALILKVWTRALDGDLKGELRHATLDGNFYEKTKESAQPDRLWITEAEWKALMPAEPKKGDPVALPEPMMRRLFRFHLVDNTRGLNATHNWKPEEIREGKLSLTVETVTPAEVTMRLEGSALLASEADIATAAKGYKARLLGFLAYDAQKKAFTRFDAVAIGEHWAPLKGAQGRAGCHPLGVAFELARGDSPLDRVPPDAIRVFNYFDPNR